MACLHAMIYRNNLILTTNCYNATEQNCTVITKSNTTVMEITKTLLYTLSKLAPGFCELFSISNSFLKTVCKDLIFFTTASVSAVVFTSFYLSTNSMYIRSFLFLSKYSFHMICHKQGKLMYISMNLLKTRAMVNSVELQEFVVV